MGVFKADGTRLTKSTVPTSAVDPLDVPKVISVDLFDTKRYSLTDPVPEGSMKRLLVRAGTVLTQRQINDLFPAATIDSIAPATGGVGGGTVVTITGSELDGVTSVTFNGVAGTALQVLSSTQLKVTTPAVSAGVRDVVLVDDGGNVTKTGGFTFA